MNPAMPLTQQYCLKWNNHKNNISGVFERLRSDERFVDVTLSTADQKSIRCHRVILSAGSGYLEDILSENPSDHPTVVLSQINFNELKNLVDFMYAGEVSIDQNSLKLLLDAARILKIKGLCESEHETGKDDTQTEEPEVVKDASTVSPTMPELKSPPVIPYAQPLKQVAGSQKRKRSRNTGSLDERHDQSKLIKHEDSDSSKLYSPLFGISNAYFLTQPPPLPAIIEKSDAKQSLPPTSLSPTDFSDVPNLLSQTPVHPAALISALNSNTLPFSSTTRTQKTSGHQSDGEDKSSTKSLKFSLSGSTPVRRYKQYTEDTLQSALKDIMEGQSINRSSVKYNIPARTLRDWMKRLNIKSVFTHHSQQKDGRGSSLDSTQDDSNEAKTETPESKVNGSAFPGMKSHESNEQSDPELDEEEEIDDDEEERLRVVSGDEN